MPAPVAAAYASMDIEPNIVSLDIQRLIVAIYGSWDEKEDGLLPSLERVALALATLPERERRVLERRFSLPYPTLAQIGAAFQRADGGTGVTRGMVWYYVHRALRKMRHPTRTRLWRYSQEQLEALEQQQRQEVEEQVLRAERLAVLFEELSQRGLSAKVINSLVRHGYEDIDVLRTAVMQGLPKIRNLGDLGLDTLRSAFGLPPLRLSPNRYPTHWQVPRPTRRRTRYENWGYPGHYVTLAAWQMTRCGADAYNERPMTPVVADVTCRLCLRYMELDKR